MNALQHPQQELRFTRAAQAVAFWLLAAVLAASSIILFACACYRGVHPELPHPMWALPPLIMAWLFAKLAMHMTRHAYLILTPLGLEVMPLFRPHSRMRVIYWQQIETMEKDPVRPCLTLHFDADKTSGVHLSLRPIPKCKRKLLIRALSERTAKK